eukprot:COSAG06_NODE_5685_length_3292_cov_2.986029_2_plen_146_part_00
MKKGAFCSDPFATAAAEPIVGNRVWRTPSYWASEGYACHFILKCIFLPRSARDNDREKHSKKTTTAFLVGERGLRCARCETRVSFLLLRHFILLKMNEMPLIYQDKARDKHRERKLKKRGAFFAGVASRNHASGAEIAAVCAILY